MKKLLNCLLICLNLVLLSKIDLESSIVTNNMDIIYNGDRTKKTIYLTFDDGYTTQNTYKILETLKEKNVFAIFFFYGVFVKEHPNVIIDILNDGHLVCNHTQNHRRVDKLTKEMVEKEIIEWEESYQTITDKPFVKLFRPPQGFMNEKAYNVITNLGYQVVHWDVQIYDYDRQNDRGVEYVLENIIKQTTNGSIILMHTMTDSNSAALPSLIDKLTESGFVFGRLEEYIYQKI